LPILEKIPEPSSTAKTISTLPKGRIPKRPRSPSPVASTSARPLPRPLPRAKTTPSTSGNAITPTAHYGRVPNSTPSVIVPQMHQGRHIQPELDARLQRMQTLREEVLRIQFQQEMLSDTVLFLQSRLEQLRKEYEAGS
jgi:hypothetical protein